MSLEKKIYLGFGLALLILVAVGIASYRANNQLIEAADWVTHTRRVIANIEALLSDLTEAESASRGYRVRNEEEFVRSYRSAAASVPQRIQRLRDLTADNPGQQRRLDELIPLIEKRLAVLQQSMRQDEPDGATLTSEGTADMERIRVSLDEMELAERQLLGSRTQAAQGSAQKAHFFILLAASLAFAVVVTSVFLIQRDVGERRRAERSIQIHADREKALAEMGQLALTGGDLDALMNEAVAVTARALGVEYAKILELDAEGGTLLLRAGVGWKEGYVGRARVSAAEGSQAGHTLQTRAPVVVADLAKETRFSGPPLLLEHGVVSGISVVILGRERAFGVLGAHTSERRVFTEEEIDFLQSVANVLTTAIERGRAEDSLRRLSTELIRSQDEERRRIARNLHDSMGQYLGLLSMNFDRMESAPGSLEPQADEILSESRDLVRQATQEIRSLSHLLHPPLLEELGLASAVQWYVKGLSQRSGINIDLDISPDLTRLPNEVELTLFRIAQESLTNVYRHSGSPTATVRIARRPDGVVLEVSDRGRGMTSSGGMGGSETPRSGVGISGMKERIREMGGTLTIQSSKEGTTVQASVPLVAEKKMAGTS